MARIIEVTVSPQGETTVQTKGYVGRDTMTRLCVNKDPVQRGTRHSFRIPTKGNHMKTFLLDIGDSTDGAIGLVVRIKAATKAEAVRMVHEALKSSVGDCGQVRIPVPERFRDVLEYINVYLNTDHITERDFNHEDQEGTA